MAMMLSYRFPTPVPIIGAYGLQLVFSVMWIGLCGKIYSNLFKPYDVLLIYSGDATENFVEKLKY